MTAYRTGCIYSEMTNKGRCSTRYVRGAKPVRCFRWVAEIQVSGKRRRFRSTSYANARFWLDCMVERYGDMPPRPRKEGRPVTRDGVKKFDFNE